MSLRQRGVVVSAQLVQEVPWAVLVSSESVSVGLVDSEFNGGVMLGLARSGEVSESAVNWLILDTEDKDIFRPVDSTSTDDIFTAVLCCADSEVAFFSYRFAWE